MPSLQARSRALVAVSPSSCSLVGPLSLPGSGSDQPALIEAPGYGAYPPGGQHAAYQHHPTTAGGRIMIGQ